MILTGENQSTQRKACPSAFLCFTNPTVSGLYQTWPFTVGGQCLPKPLYSILSDTLVRGVQVIF